MKTSINLKAKFYIMDVLRIYWKKQIILFALLFAAISYILLAVLLDLYIITDESYVSNFSFQMALNRFEFNNLSYFSSLFFKFFLVGFCIFIISRKLGKNLTLKQIINWTLLSELIYLLASMVHVFIFYTYFQGNDFSSIKSIEFLNLICFFEITSFNIWFDYFTSYNNFFSLFFILSLVFGMIFLIYNSLNKKSNLILGAYSIAFVIWIIFLEIGFFNCS